MLVLLIICINVFGEFEECRFEFFCYLIQECFIIFEDVVIELVDIIIIFFFFVFILFVEDNIVILVDFCLECLFFSFFFEVFDIFCVGDCFQLEIFCNVGVFGYVWFMEGIMFDFFFFFVFGDLCYELIGIYIISCIININICLDIFFRIIVVIDVFNYEVLKDIILCVFLLFVLDILYFCVVSYFWENGSILNGWEIFSGGNYCFFIMDCFCGEQVIGIEVSFFDEIYVEFFFYFGEDIIICL